MIRFAHTIVLFTLILQSWAQNSVELHITGYAFAADEPLIGAHIILSRTGLGTTSDVNGYFSLRISQQSIKDTLSITFIGLQDLKVPVSDVVENPDKRYDLTEFVFELAEVTVQDNQNLLKTALEPFRNLESTSSSLKRNAVFSFLQKEQSETTSLEEFFVAVYYNKQNGWPTDIGINVLTQRKSYDYSIFPQIISKKTKEGIQGPFYTGSSIMSFLNDRSNRSFFQDLTITDILDVKKERVLELTEKLSSRSYQYYVTEKDKRLVKLKVSRSSQISYYHTSKFDSRKYTRSFLRTTTIYDFRYTKEPSIQAIEVVNNFQFINKITDLLEISHDDVTRIRFLTDEVPTTESYSKNDLFERPMFHSYNAEKWTSTNSSDFYDSTELESISREESLEDQFRLTSNSIVLKNYQEDVLKPSDLKRGNMVRIDELLSSIKSNTFSNSSTLEIGWQDIPLLMLLIEDTTVISRFPRNLKSKFYLHKNTVGIVAMWLIESIRLNMTRKKTKGWYASSLPILKNIDDIQLDRTTEDGRGFLIPTNSYKKQMQAADYYTNWWQEVRSLEPSKAAKIQPIDKNQMEWF